MNPDSWTPKDELSSLLKGLQSALQSAQDAADEQQEARLGRYFREDGTPLVTCVKVPNPEGAGWRDVEIPLRALVPATSVRIKELTVEFTASVESLTSESECHGEEAPTPSVRIANRPPSGCGLATVRVVFESSPGAKQPAPDVTIRFVD